MLEPDYEADGYRQFLSDLLEGEDIQHSAAVGITKLVIDKGEESLSPKQAHVFNTQVKQVFTRPVCSLCGEPVEWDIAYEEYHSSEPHCSHCQYRLAKLESE